MQNNRKNYNKRDNRKNVKEEKSPEQKLIILSTFKVNKETPLLEFLLEKIKNDSKNNIKHYLSGKKVLVNGATTTQFDFMLSKEDVVQISKYPLKEVKKEKESKLEIIFEDDDIIAINKPSGLLSIESDSEKSNTAYKLLTDYVHKKDRRARIYTVHRIDRDTSGVLIVAKKETIKNAMQHKWNDLVTKREYIAVCEGTFEYKQGTIKNYLHENVNNVMYANNIKDGGQLSITHYNVLKEGKKYSLVDVIIDTGRKNQIRVHMSGLGHKIIGDNKYGPASDPLKRLGLHAKALEIKHPFKDVVYKLEAKTPKCFEDLINKDK